MSWFQSRFFGINEVLHFRQRNEVIKFKKAVYKLFKKTSMYTFSIKPSISNKLEILSFERKFYNIKIILHAD